MSPHILKDMFVTDGWGLLNKAVMIHKKVLLRDKQKLRRIHNASKYFDEKKWRRKLLLKNKEQ